MAAQFADGQRLADPEGGYLNGVVGAKPGASCRNLSKPGVLSKMLYMNHG
jgi:hypothetical protein